MIPQITLRKTGARFPGLFHGKNETIYATAEIRLLAAAPISLSPDLCGIHFSNAVEVFHDMWKPLGNNTIAESKEVLIHKN